MIKAVIFDMDGLLIDSEPLWHIAEIEVFSKAGIKLTEEMCLETTGLRVDSMVEYWLKRFPYSALPAEVIQKEIPNAMECKIGLSSILMPGALEAIRYTKSRNLFSAVASSSPTRLINAMINRFSLHAEFNSLVSAEHEEFGKPHPAVYLTAARILQIDASECIAVEDSVAGVAAAKAAGMICLAVPDPHAELTQFNKADVILDSLKSFPRALERIF